MSDAECNIDAVLDQADESLGYIEIVLACCSQAEPARRAIEQPSTETIFQHRDLFADRGLYDAECAGRLGKAAGLYHSHEELQCVEAIHVHTFLLRMHDA